MDEKLIREMAAQLRRRRSSLLQEVAESQEESKAIIEERESEIEETAQKDRITRLRSRLDQRGQRMIREIDSALERLAAGAYGKCERCKSDIGEGRLRAMPTATLCIECATDRERKARSAGGQEVSERLPVRDQEFEGLDTEEREE